MQEFHNKTDITLKNSFSQTQFIDWRTQPRDYKIYPKFFRRFNLDEYEELKFIKNFGKITQNKKYGNEEVKLRVNPSAGGLYPCEIYIQIRGLKGFLPGIYHYEPLDNTLCLVHELSLDGVENYFENLNQQKFVILISCAYFRSAWKYEKRAIRYLLLDVGHQIGAIHAALKLEDFDTNLYFDFEKERLNRDFGFANEEFFFATIMCEQHKEYECKKPLRESLVNVQPSDYHIKDSFIEEFYKKSLEFKEEDIYLENLLDDISKKKLQETIDNRRSIRGFKKESITKEEFEFITAYIFEYAKSFNIEIYLINNNIETIQKGCYNFVTLKKEGDFTELATKLAFNQKLGGNSAFTLIYTSKLKNTYLKDYILSGFLAHIIHLRATSLNIGCSGIGAYFDDECKKFCDTSNNILYLQAVGR